MGQEPGTKLAELSVARVHEKLRTLTDEHQAMGLVFDRYQEPAVLVKEQQAIFSILSGRRETTKGNLWRPPPNACRGKRLSTPMEKT